MDLGGRWGPLGGPGAIFGSLGLIWERPGRVFGVWLGKLGGVVGGDAQGTRDSWERGGVLGER